MSTGLVRPSDAFQLACASRGTVLRNDRPRSRRSVTVRCGGGGGVAAPASGWALTSAGPGCSDSGCIAQELQSGLFDGVEVGVIADNFSNTGSVQLSAHVHVHFTED